MQRNLKNGKTPNTSKGITLVALVITIIVLLILAGVAINMAINSDGLFGKANEAVDQYSEARKNESTAISDLFDTLTEIETGIKVEQVTDAKPGELEGIGTEADPYTINSIEDLVFFSHDVRNGNTYAEKYVKLGLSLDFNSNKSYVEPLRTDYAEYGYNGELKTLLTAGEGFKPIGDYINSDTNTFKGNFDGKGKVICNLFIALNDYSKSLRVGLFGLNEGIISNLGLENVDIKAKSLTNGTHIGSIAGQSARTATIEKCYAKGKIDTSSVSTGGITGYCSGTIKDCYSVVNIINHVEGGTGYEIRLGGIATGGASTTNITNCYNAGSIINTSIDDASGTKIGGIIANVQGTISNCYNAGEIKCVLKNVTKAFIGGFGGLTINNLTECYAKGKIILEYDDASKNVYIGGLLGNNHGATVSNCYYLSSIAEKGIGDLSGGITEDTTTAVEKESDMPSILSVVGEAFKEDTNNINNGYPILDWQ